jgi:kumamolisin
MSWTAIAAALALLSVLCRGAPAGKASDEPRVRLAGHVLPALAAATRLPSDPAAADEPLTLTLVLNRGDETGFAAYLASMASPDAAARGPSLSPVEITERFGPSREAYDAVRAFLVDRGFTVTTDSADRLTLTVAGTRGLASAAFDIAIDDFQLGDRVFYANDDDPAVPASLALLIRAVLGLNNLARPEPDTG